MALQEIYFNTHGNISFTVGRSLRREATSNIPSNVEGKTGSYTIINFHCSGPKEEYHEDEGEEGY